MKFRFLLWAMGLMMARASRNNPAFAQQLKGDGRYTGTMSFKDTAALARSARGDDPFGLRSEFVQLVELAQSLQAPAKH